MLKILLTEDHLKIVTRSECVELGRTLSALGEGRRSMEGLSLPAQALAREIASQLFGYGVDSRLEP